MAPNLFLRKVLRIDGDFERIFFSNEYKALAGSTNRTILTLLIILFLTFLALGTAVGGLENLRRKMDNPFTNWVDLQVADTHIANSISSIHERYTNSGSAEEFCLNNTSGFTKYTLNFCKSSFDPLLDAPDSMVMSVWGRTIDLDEPLFDKVLEQKGGNVLWQTNLTKEKENLSGYEIVVTQEFLKTLGFQESDSVGQLCILDEEPYILPNGEKAYRQRLLFLEVIAVVKELPSLCAFISGPKLYNVLKARRDHGRNCIDFLLVNRTGSNRFFLLTESRYEAGMDSLSRLFFKNNRPSLSPTSHRYDLLGRSLQGYALSFLPSLTPSLDSFRLFLSETRHVAPSIELLYLDKNETGCNYLSFDDYHYLAFHFDRLDRIKNFRQDMKSVFQIDLDMGQVESKKNFAMVSRLTIAISFILLGFGVLSIVMFINNILRNHLFDVRSNLGTFRAFGLQKRFLKEIYLKIILSFLVLAISCSFLVTMVIDVLEYMVMGEESRFEVFSYWLLVAVVFILGIGMYLSSRTIDSILGDTPGNLVYER